MSKHRGYERGGFSGTSNPLEDRHLKPAESGNAKARVVSVSDIELNKLRANSGKGVLKKYLYDKPLAIGEAIQLHSEQEIVEAKITAMPEGLAVGKNKSTVIEVELITPEQK